MLTATIGTGGGGKSSLSLVELIAMCTIRNLLGEQPLERCKAWYHNAEESLDEIYRRIAAICQHYKIEQSELVGWLFVTSGIEMPIKIATTKRGKLVIEEIAARAIIRAIADNEIGVVCFDPLIAHHTGTENVTGDMDQVCREFARIANVTNCSTDLVHHTRKPAPGQEELSVTDSRGAGAVKDAVRSMRVLNTMTKTEADRLGIDDVDRRLHFRVDNGKANMTPPSAANWYRFISVDIPNGDNVGCGDRVGVSGRDRDRDPGRDLHPDPDRHCQEGIPRCRPITRLGRLPRRPHPQDRRLEEAGKGCRRPHPGDALQQECHHGRRRRNRTAQGQNCHRRTMETAPVKRPTQPRGCASAKVANVSFADIRTFARVRANVSTPLGVDIRSHSFPTFAASLVSPVSGVAGMICKCATTTCRWYTAGSS